VIDAVDYISELRQAKDLSSLPVGRRVVVIGGGMTAIDIAVQSKLLGAEEVTLVYRRGQEQMNASGYEQDLAQTKGVKITHFAKPARLIGEGGAVRGIEFERTRLDAQGRLEGTGESFTLAADVVFKAIGQVFVPDGLANGSDGVRLEDGRIAVDGEGRTSLPDVWAGGDCVAGGQDLTVAAVEDGKLAAMSIDRALRAARDTGG
jgi:dihydropyrimidine dehydrogenase (NAD+) subunit PreT